MQFSGRVRIDRRTKDLCKRIEAHEIAVIDHQDIDEVAALSLVERRVKGVVNLSQSMTGKYPNQGPLVLLSSGIPVVDSIGQAILSQLREGDEVSVTDGIVYKDGQEIGRGQELSLDVVKQAMKETEGSMSEVLRQFVVNTIEWIGTEMDTLLGHIEFPELKTSLEGRHCLIVVRGANYREDLEAISSYIRDMKPALIGVDGGADALVELGYRPDVVVGDMDSVSDKTLSLAGELVVHAYTDGRAPGMERIEKLGLDASTVSSPGTSEDVAMLMAYNKGAELIVAVGTHSNVVDFLEKGRKGMSSTFLVRLRVGTRLVDARGVSKLYRTSVSPVRLLPLVAAALLPMALVYRFSTWLGQLVDLIVIRLRVLWRML
jgi:uncharacterized membrane-anchored protein